MVEGKIFDMAEEFAGVDFNSERLEKRFERTGNRWFPEDLSETSRRINLGMQREPY
jgi:hypothetical protein